MPTVCPVPSQPLAKRRLRRRPQPFDKEPQTLIVTAQLLERVALASDSGDMDTETDLANPHLPAMSSFERDLSSPGLAREYVDHVLDQAGITTRRDDVRLCVSELATNALLHATAPGRVFLVSVHVDPRHIRVEVHDSDVSHPAPRHADQYGSGGRGLLIVAALADRWGITGRDTCGKTAWTEFDRTDTR